MRSRQGSADLLPLWVEFLSRRNIGKSHSQELSGSPIAELKAGDSGVSLRTGEQARYVVPDDVDFGITTIPTQSPNLIDGNPEHKIMSSTSNTPSLFTGCECLGKNRKTRWDITPVRFREDENVSE